MPRIAEIDNLLLAYHKAIRGKRGKRSVIEYSQNLCENIYDLRQQLLSNNVKVGCYNYFKIYDPKERLICAASFRERVLHHAIIYVCGKYFERHLIDDTYATRVEKGVYAALDRASIGMRRCNFVAKLDVRKYFDSISHIVLKDKLQRLFKDKALLTLLYDIIDSYSVADDRGIPIGNLTSQYFANYYLSSLDHYMKEKLGVPVYVRYMDDMLVFGESKECVKRYVLLLKEYIEKELSLTLKPEVINSTRYGVSFLGYSVYRHKLLLNRKSKLRFKRKLLSYTNNFQTTQWDEHMYQQHLLPLLAFVGKAYTKKLRRSVCASIDC